MSNLDPAPAEVAVGDQPGHAGVEVIPARKVPLGGPLGSFSVDDPGLDGPISSSATAYFPLLGAELSLQPHAVVTLVVDPTHEHGILADRGPVFVGQEQIAAAELGYIAPGQARTGSRSAPVSTAVGASCSEAFRSVSRSSCGGTSSVARTRRSRCSAPSGSPDWRGSRPASGACATTATHSRPRRCLAFDCGPGPEE